MSWQRLIRFIADSGVTTYGDPCMDDKDDVEDLLKRKELFAMRLEGDDPFELTTTDERVRVDRLLGVLTPANVSTVKCIGLNYVKHILESGRKPPPFPSLFMKPPPAIAAFDEDVQVPEIAQGKNLDYEGELAVVIGKTGKNITQKDALQHIAGYAASNDVSARTWQRDPAYAGGIPQWSFAKSFDTFAPVGYMLVSPAVVGAADNLQLRTTVNGETRQDANTSDLLFNAAYLVSFLSQGATLQKGTVIMTGTPDGVALGMKEPKWLQHGDVVEVNIEGLGCCRNRIAFEKL
ncbi:hypothetical protein BKA63DRAFT_459536 [Paraphoma chrysanthemicola]|nr:hypothetical protein BKA63DRAFT_459536 [Paraphoma chrysanthemicola]